MVRGAGRLQDRGRFGKWSRDNSFLLLLLSTVPFVFLYSCGGPKVVISANRPPVADAGPDVTVFQGQKIRLDASGSYDPDGKIMFYHWVQIDGTPLMGSNLTTMSPEIIAPFVGPQGEELRFMVTVTDDGGLSHSDTVKVNVEKYLFFDDFETDTTRNYVFSNADGYVNSGKLLYDRTLKRVRVIPEFGDGLQFSRDVPACYEGTFSFIFSIDRSHHNRGMIRVLLLENSRNYYEIFIHAEHGTGGIRKVINGQEVDSKKLTKGYAKNIIYPVHIIFNKHLSMLNVFEDVIFINRDHSPILVKEFSIYTVGEEASFDNIVLTQDPFIRIFIKNRVGLWNSKLSVKTITGNMLKGWGIKFVLDHQKNNQQIVYATNEPFEATFDNVSLSNHTIDAFIMDHLGTKVFAHDKIVYTTKDGYYVAVGDSITKGFGDEYPSENASSTRSNRSGGYQPVLEKLLESAKGYPHTIVNKGIGGITSEEGLSLIPSILAAHPEANYYLILFGTNDSGEWIPSGKGLNPGDPGYAYTFKYNMQQIVSLILDAGKTPLLAKVPIVFDGTAGRRLRYRNLDSTPRNRLIRDYNVAIEELVIANGIPVSPPDFYSYFKAHREEFSDEIHPNGKGYRSMARLWLRALSIETR